MLTFKDLGLESNLIQAVEDLGFQTPTDVQKESIPVLLKNETDLVALAQTGTGKTAAFGMPLLQKIDSNSKHTQGLILSPTRELCIQITKEIQTYAKYIPNVNIVAVYGGANIQDQSKKIKKGAQIIVATPGRMQDMQRRRMVDIKKIDYCILDEADEMLNMGFYEDITAILSEAPKEKNTWLFSATMPSAVAKIAKKFMNSPKEITIGSKNAGAKNVSHECYTVSGRQRFEALKRLVDAHPTIFGCIFCRTKRDTQKVAENLIESGYNAAALHGDLSQNQRDTVMNSFRKKQIQLLVATDVAARGIDVDNITHVINYQLSDESEVYTHRSGRTGRAGNKGVSIIIVTQSEHRKIRSIEKLIQSKITHKTIPDADEICNAQLFHLAKKLRDVNPSDSAEKLFSAFINELDNLSKEDVLKRLVTIELDRFHNYYSGKSKILDTPKKDFSNNDSKSRVSKKDEVRYHINIGERDNYDWRSLKDLVKGTLGFTGDEIFHVDVMKNFSFFSSGPEEKEKVLDGFKFLNIDNRDIEVSITEKFNPKKAKKSKSRNRGGSYSGRSRPNPFKFSNNKKKSGKKRNKKF
ncbi:MAG: DEAD/DEAH box helicase [Flavobacteriaceae bacterium]|nr:DEAD/DEAH box helicase [Flavobacteriaceae bacterium]